MKPVHIILIIILCLFLTTPVYAATSQEQIRNEKREAQYNDSNNWLTLKGSEGGVRFVTKDGKESILIDNFGGIYFNGDVFVNNKKLNDVLEKTVNKDTMQIFMIFMISIFLIFFLIMLTIVLKLRKQLTLLRKQSQFQEKSNM